MAKTGRPRKPTQMKVLEGNRGKRPLPANEPKPAPATKDVKPPTWMNTDGKKMWKRLVPILQRLQLLTEADLESFSMLCQSWGDYVEHVKDIKKNGKYCIYVNKGGGANEVERPAVKLMHRAYERYKALCSEFGLTPASRTRIEIKPSDEEYDPMEALLSGVK